MALKVLTPFDPFSADLAGKADKADLPLNVKDYGAVGDGVADDTAALQNFITYIVLNGKRGYIPAGVYKITSALDFSSRPSWSIYGDGPFTTTIKQFTSNTPILNLGSDSASSMHSWRIESMGLDYSSIQAAGNTSANPILFSQMGFEGLLRDLYFANGSYAMRVASGIGCPWGTTLDDLRFGSGLTAGAMDWSNGVNAVPNNHFGRILASCDNMTGPVFNIKGYNFTIDTIEFLSATNCQLMTFAGGSQVQIGALKLEIGTYTVAGSSLFEFVQDASASIGTISVSGTTMAVTSPGTLTILKTGSGGSGGSSQGGRVVVDRMVANASSMTGAGYLVQCGRPHTVEIGSVSMSGGFVLQNSASSTSGDALIVRSWLNDQVTQDRGDADYTVATTDTNVNRFGTAFTAQRTITLPNADLHNGLYYEFIFDGAINGPNNAVIKVGASTLKTVAADKTVVRYTWRRNAALGTGAWVLTKNHSLADVASETANATTTRGDVTVTLTTADNRYQYYNTTLTTNRTITLPNTGVVDGLEFEIIRVGGGAFTLQVTDPLTGKNFVFGAGVKGFVRYRARSASEWIVVGSGVWTGTGVLPTISAAIRTVSSNYTAVPSDLTIQATGGVSGITVTLPAHAAGQTLKVRKADSGAGAVTVAPASGTINGASTFVLAAQYDSAIFESDGSEWSVF